VSLTIDFHVRVRLARLELELPSAPAPAGSYRPVVVRNGIGHVSGQFPFVRGQLQQTGRVGAEITEADGFDAAKTAALNVLAQIDAALGGFDDFGGLIHVDGYVASAPGYVSQPRVLDGASQVFIEVLGPELGAHTRVAIAVDQLPLNSPLELGVTFAVRQT